MRPTIHFIALASVIAIVTAGLATASFATCYFLECDDDAPKQSPPPTPPAPTPNDPPAVPPKARKRSFWNHNGSVVYLTATGNKREFYYSHPRPGMVAEGVTPDTLLFAGIVNGNTYQGTAFLFSARCGPRSYPVAGTVQETAGRVVMTGNATNVNSRCQISSVVRDVLVFQYLYSE